MQSGSKEVIIAAFEESDCLGVRNVIRTVWREFGHHSEPAEEADLRDIPGAYREGASGFWTAKANARVVGCLGLKDSGDGWGVLKRMYVLPEFRGPTVGTALQLLQALLQQARSHDLEALFLGTPEVTKRAHRYYEKNEFKRVTRADLPPSFMVDPVDVHFFCRRLA